MSRAVLLTSPTRVEAVGLLWSLRGAGIDARTDPAERNPETGQVADPDDVAVILALDIDAADLEDEVERCRSLLGRHVPAVVFSDRRFRPERRPVPGVSRVLDAGLDTAAVLLLLRRLVEEPDAPHPSSAVGATEDDGCIGGLTAREEQVADLASLGLRNEEIADRLEISVHTVRTHVGRVLAKLEVQHRVALHARLRQLRRASLGPRTRVSA